MAERGERDEPKRRAAVFLDRDGTIIAEGDFLADPAKVRLLPGSAEGIRALRERGFLAVIVSNQSGVGRGMFTEADVVAVNREMERQLADKGAALDGIYYCTAAPAGSDPLVIEHPDRKPAPGMLFKAAGDLGIDLGRSWMIGDSARDLLAGENAGCRGSIRVRTGKGRNEREEPTYARFPEVADLAAAAAWILGAMDSSPADATFPPTAKGEERP